MDAAEVWILFFNMLVCVFLGEIETINNESYYWAMFIDSSSFVVMV